MTLIFIHTNLRRVIAERPNSVAIQYRGGYL